MEDQEIIKLFYERSDQAIHELAEKYGKLFRKIAANILNNFDDVEECVNDAYLGAWNSIPPENPNPLSTYVCKIVRNLSLKKYHANTAAKRNSLYDIALGELEECIYAKETVESEVSKKELMNLLNQFLSELDVESRVIFVRRYWYGDAISDIANDLGKKRNTISVRLKRIRQSLKVYLQKEGVVI